ncbi:hypothetical protein Tco_0323083 [Tanacetum coccineum]
MIGTHVDHVFEADECDAIRLDVDEESRILRTSNSEKDKRDLRLEVLVVIHDESKLISKLERECLNLQLKYQHLQESFDKSKSHTVQEAPDFKITRAHTSEKTSTMLNEIESLKAQLRSTKEPCFTSDYVKPKVLAPGNVCH